MQPIFNGFERWETFHCKIVLQNDSLTVNTFSIVIYEGKMNDWCKNDNSNSSDKTPYIMLQCKFILFIYARDMSNISF